MQPPAPTDPLLAGTASHAISPDRISAERPDPRPLGVRMMPGLQAIETWTRQGRVWILFDPVVRQYHHLLDEEYQLLRMLDVSSGFASIRARFEAGDPRRRLDAGRFMRQIHQWYRSGLVESVWPDQAESLLVRRDRERRQRFWGSLRNPLMIRLPGFDPRRMLNGVEPWMRWIFQPAGTLMLVVLWSVVLVIGLTTWPQAWERLPGLAELTDPRQWLLIWVTTAVVKVLHELGHGVACRRHGVEPKEMGVLLMFFTPFLFCDVTDAWRLPRARDRIAISAAGMRVELLVAALAALLWWFTQPGVLHHVCLVIMVLGSVNTLLVNGNPLLRYDGYYILSDAWGVTNLWQRSRQRVGDWFGRLVLGLAPPARHDEETAKSKTLLVYGVASLAYRWFVLAAVLWLAYRLLQPWGWGNLAIVIGLWMVVVSAAAPSIQWYRRLVTEASRPTTGRWRRLGAAVLLLTGLGFAGLVPIPNRMNTATVFRPDQADEVFVTVGGTLTEILQPPNSAVRVGEPIVRLRDTKLEVERLRLQGELRRAEAWEKHLEARGAIVPEARTQLPAARAKREDVSSQLRQLEGDLRRLDLIAPQAGQVWPVARPRQPPAEGRLKSWDGDPLNVRNQGAFLNAGTHVCSVGPKDRWQAFLFVDQDRIERLRPGLVVWLYPQHLPAVRLPGTILNLARVNADSVPPVLADEVEPRTAANAAGNPRIYQVQVAISDPNDQLLVEGRGRAVIWLDRRTGLDLARDWLATTLTLW